MNKNLCNIPFKYAMLLLFIVIILNRASKNNNIFYLYGVFRDLFTNMHVFYVNIEKSGVFFQLKNF